MPKETFYNLSEEKKIKILNAAKLEFSRVPIEKASIKNIVEKADIARGSFYQYFESKEDLLEYIITENMGNFHNKMFETIQKNNGDIIKIYKETFQILVETCSNKENIKLFRKIFENAKSGDNMFFKNSNKENEHKKMQKILDELYEKNKNKLKVNNKKDFKCIIEILSAITRRAVIVAFRDENTKKAKEEYIKELEFVKYGIIRKGEEEKQC